MGLNLKIDQLLSLRQDIGDCIRCGLCQGRKNIVFGEGSLLSGVIFIGEAPGQNEDERGRPFVGKSGELLEQALDKAGWAREDVYIANVNKCRPPGNREPTPEEQAACGPFLLRQIEIISPRLLVPLGRVSGEYLLGRSMRITKERGQLFSFGPRPEIFILPTFHPSYVLRNRTKEIVEAFYSDIAKAKELS